ncbi:MAG TPA: YafY family protein [Flavobacteriales bacterium]|nr:YafY family protein [Flavobacteriales bacterium]
MNRVERISAILIQLQSKKIVKGQDLADRFSISLRTAYRDIKALEEAGVPIVSEAGIGYSLMDGYKLPPVMFTKEEAIAFLTAEKLVEKLTDSSTYSTYQSALFKIKAVLKTDDKEHLEKMDSYIEVLNNPYLPHDKKTSNHIQTILRSISQKKQLSLNYFANHNQQNSNRAVEPVGIFLMGQQWYLIAFCCLRNAYRNFRIDRIQKSVFTEQPFQKQHPPLKTWLAEMKKEKKELHTIVIRVETDKMKYLGEQKFYNGFVAEKPVKDLTEMTFVTSSIEGFARWYMMFGDHAEIVGPKSLKDRVKQISSTILKNSK